MANTDTAAARRFHAATKYVPVAPPDGQLPVSMGTPPNLEDALWERDASLEPFPYKIYESLPGLELPREFRAPSVPALTALTRADRFEPARPVDRELLARIALHTNGLLNRGVPKRDGTIHQFRTAGGTGARYHLELYFVCADLPGLAAGVYHYDAREHVLRCLRTGDFRDALVDATGGEPATAAAPVVLALTSTFWRNAWRYKARAYRHTFWDAGTSLANVLAVCASAEQPARVVLGYADGDVNTVLDVDGEREATVALCAIGAGATRAPAAPPTPRLGLPTRAISPSEVTFDDIPAMHAASSLESGEQAANWRTASLERRSAAPSGRLLELDAATGLDTAGAEDLIMRRRSTRNYHPTEPTPFPAFSTLLDISAAPVDADYASAVPPHDLYLIVNRVDGVPAGSYIHHPDRRAIELLAEGNFRDDAQRLALGQEYPGRADVNCYYLADLEPLLDAYGNRGYRMAQLDAALRAGRMHLATHGLGCGAVGSTSFDDEVIDFFSPHAAGKSYLFITVFGRRRRP